VKALNARGVSNKNRNHHGWSVGRIGANLDRSEEHQLMMTPVPAGMGAACDRVNDNARLFAALCRIRTRAGRRAVDPAGEILRGPVQAAAEFFDPTRNWHRDPGIVLAARRERL
jgi:hypothetical protein